MQAAALAREQCHADVVVLARGCVLVFALARELS